MSDDAERWKEKYLKSLERFDQRERLWEARLDLLRQGLVRSSLAAEGSDKAVDQCMKEMRKAIRRDDLDAPLAALMPRLEQAVLESEQRRETRMAQVSQALGALVGQLQGLPAPSDVRRGLKQLARRLEEGVAQSRELPPVLGELSELQGRALEMLISAPHTARPGLLDRLFGPRAASAAQGEVTSMPAEPLPRTDAALSLGRVHGDVQPAHDDAIEQAADVEAPLPEVTELPVPETDLRVEEQREAPLQSPALPPDEPASVATPHTLTDTAVPVDPDAGTSVTQERPGEDMAFALPDAAEPAYSQVAEHVERILIGLLDDLELDESYQEPMADLRKRLIGGLNWYELIPLLHDLAALMLAVNNSGQQAFDRYLEQLNERLDLFQRHLLAASEGHADQAQVARALDDRLREQVDELSDSVRQAAPGTDLKLTLERRLDDLLGTLDDQQRVHDQREQAMTDALEGMAARVATMEREAQHQREDLELQRQKTLLDPLTGLLNRAGWAEHLSRALGAWQTQRGELWLVMLDLDHFKRINDSYGHLAGDKVLKIVAQQLRRRLRPQDCLARFGGEEFVLVFPEEDVTAALAFARALCSTVSACPFHFKGERVVITASIGLTAFQPGESTDEALRRADAALYRAKAQGRDQVQRG